MIGQLYQKEVRSFIFFLEQPRFLALKYFFVNEKQLKEKSKEIIILSDFNIDLF